MRGQSFIMGDDERGRCNSLITLAIVKFYPEQLRRVKFDDIAIFCPLTNFAIACGWSPWVGEFEFEFHGDTLYLNIRTLEH